MTVSYFDDDHHGWIVRPGIFLNPYSKRWWPVLGGFSLSNSKKGADQVPFFICNAATDQFINCCNFPGSRMVIFPSLMSIIFSVLKSVSVLIKDSVAVPATAARF